MKPSFDADEFERSVREDAERVSSKPKRRAEKNGHGSKADEVLPSPAKPMAVARVFVAQHHTESAELTLRYWRGAWWSWRQSHWRELEPREVRGELYAFTEHGTYLNDQGQGRCVGSQPPQDRRPAGSPQRRLPVAG